MDVQLRTMYQYFEFNIRDVSHDLPFVGIPTSSLWKWILTRLNGYGRSDYLAIKSSLKWEDFKWCFDEAQLYIRNRRT